VEGCAQLATGINRAAIATTTKIKFHFLKNKLRFMLQSLILVSLTEGLMRKLPVLLAQCFNIRVSKGAKPLGGPQG